VIERVARSAGGEVGILHRGGDFHDRAEGSLVVVLVVGLQQVPVVSSERGIMREKRELLDSRR